METASAEVYEGFCGPWNVIVDEAINKSIKTIFLIRLHFDVIFVYFFRMLRGDLNTFSFCILTSHIKARSIVFPSIVRFEIR